jgi:hypothetical protein
MVTKHNRRIDDQRGDGSDETAVCDSARKRDVVR